MSVIFTLFDDMKDRIMHSKGSKKIFLEVSDTFKNLSRFPDIEGVCGVVLPDSYLETIISEAQTSSPMCLSNG